ncbi:EAL domain-containing protein [Allorhizobium sp. BGMRC 0089]|uniref:putative bifunctional diguanylate cyclase/phosphodiesterase n=1 Tax=Allorhizobium sonneratiae TaxID=2934936 RepID=UPI0020344381|nr:EAL domain-containing protein [Allorhizobium sonneratiae]MCM2291656.1 EAL domain-containing protein [Allorhizobium sonneratiae]
MRFSPIPRTAAGRDALVLAVVGIGLWMLIVFLNINDVWDGLLSHQNLLELDELFDVAAFTGILGFIYAYRRLRDLRLEMQKRSQVESEKEWLANHDPLTLLPNRRALETLTSQGVNSQSDKRYVIYAIDLDGFKGVNDLIGHQGGDLLLRAVADRLQQGLPDSTVYRLGGDEFLVIAERQEGVDAGQAGLQLLKRISAPYDIGGMTAEIGASIGFALYPEDGNDLDDAAHCADVAMYVAKRSGRNHVYGFERIMEDQVLRRAETELALKNAIREGLIKPYYQPLIDLRSGRLRGFEALARWQTGPNNYVPPGDFIELAEAAGLIGELSDSLLRQACRDAARWPEALLLAFNISPTQLLDRGFVEKTCALLQETGFPPKRLELEITETALVRDTETVIAILTELQNRGVRIALDDFGTGYSSLSQLSKFQFDKLKIDQSFIAGVMSDKKQEDIVRAIMHLGKGLGIVTTAEGIERNQQLEFMKDLGCDIGQGYLFGKAMPADQTLDLIASFSKTEMQRKIAG